MAQLKDSVVQGSLRVTDTTYTNDLIVGDTSAPTIANHDYLLVADASDGNKLLKGPVFDGVTVSKALTQKGTWANFTANTGTVTSITIKTTAPLTGGSNTATTTTGSYTIALANQNANLVLAGPESGAAAAPAFRSLVAADLPTATTAALGIVKVGSNINVTSGVISVTAASTSVSGVTKYGTAANTALQGNQNLFSLNGATKNAAAAASFYAPTAAGTKDQVLVSTAGAPTWRNDRGIEFIRGEWSAASGTWVGTTQDAALYDGKQIILYMPFAGSGNATLELTLNGVAVGTAGAVTTGAKNVYFESSNRFTTHKGQNAQIHLIYHSGLKLSNGTTYEGWWYLANRDTNDNTTAYQMRYNQSVFKVDNTTNGTGRALGRYKLMLQKPDGQLTPVSTKGNSTATTDETIYDGEFLINGEILYYNSTSAVSVGGAIGAGSLWKQVELNLSYSFNTGSTLIVGKEVYLKALPTYMDSPCAKLYKNNNWSNMAINANTGVGAGCITQNIYDGHRDYIYIKLGIAYSTTNIILTEEHPIYYGASADSRIPYGPVSGSMYSSIFTGQASLSDFKTWIVSIAKSKPSGTMTPIGFYLNITNANSWAGTNLVTDGRSSSIRFAGFLHTEKYTNSSNQLVEVSGDLFFWEVIDILNPNANIVRQTYLWQFDCETSDTTGGIWKYNFARSLPSTYEHAAQGYFDTSLSATTKAMSAIRQNTDGSIETQITPIRVVEQDNAMTLTASNWSNTAPYTQTIIASEFFFTDNWEPIVGLNTKGITQEVYEQACDAQIVCTNCSLSVANSTFTFTAFGEKPTVSIPVSITVFFSP